MNSHLRRITGALIAAVVAVGVLPAFAFAPANAIGTVQVAGHALAVATGQPGDDVNLTSGDTASGTVKGPRGPLAGARVQAYAYDAGEAEWVSTGQEARTTGNGSFVLTGLDGDGPFTLRVVKANHAVGFLGGGEAFSTPNSRNSVALNDGNATGLNVTLAERASTLGKVAGQRLDYCLANELLPNDDESTDAIDLPFNLTYFGNSYTQLYVNNNGNVTFDGPLSQYTPDALDGAQTKPIIAPFFADVDTRDVEESDIVTYGQSPNGNQFCVNWVDVEPYVATEVSGRLNSFQLLLTKREGVAGRSAGDFDITYNYDQIQWDTGSASHGISAVVGYASGSGEEGTFFQLPGSLSNGAFLDGGAQALVRGKQSSNQVGRYVFEVRNDARASTLGGLSGKVLLPSGAPAVGVYVEVVRGARVYYTTTNSSGVYALNGVAAGAYDLRAWPSSDALIQAGATAQVRAGQNTVVPDIKFTAPAPMPSTVGLSSSSSGEARAGQVPTVVPWEPLRLRYTGTAGGTATYRVIGLSGDVIRSGTLVAPAGSGNYVATIPDLAGAAGSVRIEITFTPAGGATRTTGFDVYIDPSGTVVDPWGRPVAGATVTLLRSEEPDGDFTAVANGSALMSSRNRRNPDTSGATGAFGWDVTAAWYKVRVQKAGYTTFTSVAMQVPPERLDLVLKLSGGSAPVLKSTVSGPAQVGAKLTAKPPVVLTADFAVTGYRWFRDGTQIGGASASTYVLTAADRGKKIHAQISIKRRGTAEDPLHPTENLIDFAAFTSKSDPTPTILAAAARPTVRSAVVGSSVKASLGGWTRGYSVSYQWLREGVAIRGATQSAYRVKPADAGRKLSVRVTARSTVTSAQMVTSNAVKVVKAKPKLRLRATAGKKGKAKLTATLVLPGTSKKTTKARIRIYDGKKLVKKKTILIKKGKGSLTLSKVKKGKHTFKVTFVATKAYKSGSAKAKVKVR